MEVRKNDGRKEGGRERIITKEEEMEEKGRKRKRNEERKRGK